MILITGGASGIGAEIAARFCAAGRDVLITGRREQPLRETAGRVGARALVCDNADPANVAALAAFCAGGVDVLVNNAGANTSIGRTEPATPGDVRADWEANFTSNVLTAVLTTSALRPLLRDGGRVINVGSIAAETGAGSYGAAKAAVSAWTADLAGELGCRGITVNAIAPGFIDDTEFFHGRLSDERREALQAATATGRVGEPSDIAELAVFLASSAARHITGQTVHVNGGAWTTR